MPPGRVEIDLGLEVCRARRPTMLEGARFGLLMNRASVDRDWHYACDVLAEVYPGQLAALFTPQHGLWGEQQANMIETTHGWHRRLGVPVYSLYSEIRRPTREMLSALNCLVVDLQDVGTRVYTFVWTVMNCLEACAAAGVSVLILDRPNPLGGRLVEGPLLAAEYRSFVGQAEIPMRHGLTIGELARLIADKCGIDVDIEVIAMQGWSRDLTFTSLARRWIPPSPNLPRFESALVYAGQVLLEGTNLSEGRGTTTPFEVCGAPFVESEVLCDVLSAHGLPGVRFLPIRFLPAFDKWSSSSCGGIALHVTDAAAFRPYRTSVAILAAVCHTWPDDFAWRQPPYEYESTKLPVDILSGNSTLRERLERSLRLSKTELDELALSDDTAWHRHIHPYRLYE